MGNMLFWYLSDNSTRRYKKIAGEYLAFVFYKFRNLGNSEIEVMVKNSQTTPFENPDSVKIFDYADSGKELREACECLVSNKRGIIPRRISCDSEEDYSMIENILRKNYGDAAKLTTGFFGFGKLFNERKIKTNS